MKLLNTYYLTSNNLRISFDYLLCGFDFIRDSKEFKTYTNAVEKRLQIKDFPEARRITRN
ncbi:hypothetical protein HYP07_gp056 [Vibrio phage JSF3]|uniref:hypothetical protein n=1 Tax=Vibrio phage JSF3 TaxID=1916111 RepID=UPI000B60253C|nr:hypothetical protein HYP07_gp056 [Vibrio phage JSF3]APD18068.1 hypothetical protein [Vibrio phage JSF3]